MQQEATNRRRSGRRSPRDRYVGADGSASSASSARLPAPDARSPRSSRAGLPARRDHSRSGRWSASRRSTRSTSTPARTSPPCQPTEHPHLPRLLGARRAAAAAPADRDGGSRRRALRPGGAARKALFPLRPGRYTIEPSGDDVIVRIVERGFFGPAPRPPASRSCSRRRRLPVEVQPLPPPPPGFRAARSASSPCRASSSPRELRLGEAATLTVTLAGRGQPPGGTAAARSPRAPGSRSCRRSRRGGGAHRRRRAAGTRRPGATPSCPERAGQLPAGRSPAIPYFDPASGPATRWPSAPAWRSTLPAAASRPAGSGADPAATAAGAGGRRASAVRLWRERWRRLLPWLAAPLGLAPRWSPSSAGGGPGAARAWPASAAPWRAVLREAEAEERPRQAAARIEEAWRDFLDRALGDPAGDARSALARAAGRPGRRSGGRATSSASWPRTSTTCATRPSSRPPAACAPTRSPRRHARSQRLRSRRSAGLSRVWRWSAWTGELCSLSDVATRLRLESCMCEAERSETLGVRLHE